MNSTTYLSVDADVAPDTDADVDVGPDADAAIGEINAVTISETATRWGDRIRST